MGCSGADHKNTKPQILVGWSKDGLHWDIEDEEIRWQDAQGAARRGTTDSKASYLFEVIAGKSMLRFRRDDPENVPPSSTCFVLVRRVDTQPKRRLFDLLTAQCMQANQQLMFFSGAGGTLHSLQRQRSAQVEASW